MGLGPESVWSQPENDLLNNTDPSLKLHRDQFQGSLIRCDGSHSFKLSVFTDFYFLGQD